MKLLFEQNATESKLAVLLAELTPHWNCKHSENCWYVTAQDSTVFKAKLEALMKIMT